MGKNIFKKITIYFILLIVFLIAPIIKIQAYIITPVSGPSGPSDNALPAGPFKFSFEFTVTKETGDLDTDQILFAFTKMIDGKQATIWDENFNEVKTLYPYNQTVGTAVTETQHADWGDWNPASFDAKTYSWSLKDYYDSTKVFANNKSFTLSQVTKGFYYITKEKSTLDVGQYFYTLSDRFDTETLCLADQNEQPAEDIYKECAEYDSLPATPANTVIPPAEEESTTEETTKTELNYYPLAPLPGVGEENCEKDSTTGKTVCVKLAPQVCETDKSGKETCRPCTADDSASECKPGLGFAGYLNAMIKIFIGICAVLAMIMIVMGGIQYMTSELVSGKAAGKEQITHAILGLLLALGAYAILNTINPNLLDVSLSGLPTATITIMDGESGITSKTGTITVDGKSISVTACDEGSLETINVFGTTAKVNKSVSSSLKEISTAWENGGKKYPIIIKEFSSYCCRNIRGDAAHPDAPKVKELYGRTDPPYANCGELMYPTGSPMAISNHAFGLAIDINITANPMQTPAEIANNSPMKTDMNTVDGKTFVKLFTDRGWTWGGNYSGRKDPMHFEVRGAITTAPSSDSGATTPTTSSTFISNTKGSVTFSYGSLKTSITNYYSNKYYALLVKDKNGIQTMKPVTLKKDLIDVKSIITTTGEDYSVYLLEGTSSTDQNPTTLVSGYITMKK